MTIDLSQISPSKARELIRENKLRGPTTGAALGYTQMNVIILPQKYSDDFEQFCYKNKKFCPIIEVIKNGRFSPEFSAKNADIRTDLPSYDVIEGNRVKRSVSSIKDIWSDDLVTFLFGCSFTFENRLIETGINLRHITEHKNVSMYRTKNLCVPVGNFSGEQIVSMRPIKKKQLNLAIQVTEKFQMMHGAPIHWGDPQKLGIFNLGDTDFGDPVDLYSDEIPVFWACGVTGLNAIRKARLDIAITHTPGHMFISDLPDSYFEGR
jgi:uncharacterized protein YcsI (UPF0317 family)